MLRTVSAFREPILLCLFFVLSAAATNATSEDYIDETLVYATVERGAIEPGYWFDIGRSDSLQFMRPDPALTLQKCKVKRLDDLLSF